MARTSEQELDDKIEVLQLKLIDENAALDALMPVTEKEFMGHDPERAQERRLHEGKRDGISKQIAFLTSKISQTSKSRSEAEDDEASRRVQGGYQDEALSSLIAGSESRNLQRTEGPLPHFALHGVLTMDNRPNCHFELVSQFKVFIKPIYNHSYPKLITKSCIECPLCLLLLYLQNGG
jgi:hypothetical protein